MISISKSVFVIVRCIGMIALAMLILFFELNHSMKLAQAAQVVLPDQGVEFAQVDFLFEAGWAIDSDWGRLRADPDALFDATGISSGYINVYTDAGWVVQNLPVDASGGVLTTYFSLGLVTPTDVNTLSAYVVYDSAGPQVTFADGTRSSFPVAIAIVNAEGLGVSGGGNMGPGPDPNQIVFGLGLDTWMEEQPHRPNVQTADDQCFPMSIANSLQHLEDRFGLEVPHHHKKGLKGDNTLVGKLDDAANRDVTSRKNGDGVLIPQMLQGKFSYLADPDVKLNDKLVHRHQGSCFGHGGGDIQGSGITSKQDPPSDGSTVTWQWICEQIHNREDVEMVYRKPDGGGHAVRVFACGKILGVPFIKYLHDAEQTSDLRCIKGTNEGATCNDDSDCPGGGTCKGDPNDTKGLEEVFAWCVDTDNDDTINLHAAPQVEVCFAMSESIKPEGGSTNAQGSTKDVYRTNETIYASGNHFPVNANVCIYIVEDRAWTDADPVPADVSGDGMNTVQTDGSGNLEPVSVWEPPLTVGEYDIVFDANCNGIYDAGTDVVDNPNHPGFAVIAAGTGGSVGGTAEMANKIQLMAPWIVLTVLVLLSAGVIIRRFKKQS
jgi:hypothetical protein